MARAGNGDWRIYSAYHDAQQVVSQHGLIYVKSAGGLYSYNPDDTSIETYDKANVLSDFGIYRILPCKATNELVILYNNGNIDLLDKNGDVFNMPDLKIKTLGDKTIQDVLLDGSTLYISVSSGVVCVDLKERFFGNFYPFSTNTYGVALLDDYIYVVTKGNIYKGLTTDNLLDPNNWKLARALSVAGIYSYAGNLLVYNASTIYRVANLNTFGLGTVVAHNISHWNYLSDGRLVAYSKTGTAVIINEDLTTTAIESSDQVFDMTYVGGNYWAACADKGLQAYKLDENALTQTVSSIIPNSPRRNNSYNMQMIDNERLLIAGGAFNYNGTHKDGTLMRYENNTWYSFDEEEPINQFTATFYRDLTDLIQDPDDPNHHYASAACSGLYEFQDFKLKNHYTYDNSPLTTILPSSSRPGYYVRITGLNFDSQHNLWMCNNEVDTIVRILKNDGTWTSYYSDKIKGFPTFDHIVFDQRGWAWLNSRRLVGSVSKSGFLAINTNDNPGDPSRFSDVFISSFVNQDGTAYSTNLFNCMTEDLDGAMWFGCDQGLFVSYNPANVFNSDFYLSQVKVPRNDGSGLADYLLSGLQVKCITIDGGNRKWIGTTGNGVYLVSADGLEQIAHFTTDNSPLIHDEIYDIKINGTTGEVFIATEAGLVSYMGDATDPAPDFNEDNVKVYPNPVRPEYQGNIAITGLMYNSTVKIVNAAGRLVNEGTSVGGEYTWNGRLASGKRVASGIYYVLGADEGGKKGVVSKFLIVKE